MVFRLVFPRRVCCFLACGYGLHLLARRQIFIAQRQHMPGSCLARMRAESVCVWGKVCAFSAWGLITLPGIRHRASGHRDIGHQESGIRRQPSPYVMHFSQGAQWDGKENRLGSCGPPIVRLRLTIWLLMWVSVCARLEHHGWNAKVSLPKCLEFRAKFSNNILGEAPICFDIQSEPPPPGGR